MLKELAQGFRLSATTSIISNLTKVFLDFSKEESGGSMKRNLMMLAPIATLALSGKMDLQFEDFDEVEEHPMAGPFLATFDQLFKKFTREELSTLNDVKLEKD